MRDARRCVPLLVLALAAADAAPAQVSGIVVDQSLRPMAGALVSLRATGVRATTDADGGFAFPDATGAGLAVVAARKGYFNASATVAAPAAGVRLMLFAVPQSDDPRYALLDPWTCGTCHPEQVLEWEGSAMANAGVNTWVHDTYDGDGTPRGLGGFVYTRDSMLAVAHPASECASCHEPETWIASPFTALTDPAAPTPAALHGVSCEVCHKIANVDESRINAPGIYPGAVTFTRPSVPTYVQVQYGLLGDVAFSQPSVMRASYQPQLAAAVCGTCHQDKNDPDLDEDFDEPGGVVSEPTYLEWRESPYGDEQDPRHRTCVDCHMPPAPERAICTADPVLRAAGTTRSHRIEGTTPAFLENAAELAFADARFTGGELVFDVHVVNAFTGHHLPTGVTIRNMILLVEAWNAGDGVPLAFTGTQVVHELGGVGDPAAGYYAGLPGKLFAKVIHDPAGRWPTFFTDAAGVLFDNRIPALATDVSTYRFAVPPGEATLRVRARLLYRRSFRALADAKGWTEDGHGNPLADVTPPDYGHVMETAELTMVSAACTGAPAACDDGDPCTLDDCDPSAGCTNVIGPRPDCTAATRSTVEVRDAGEDAADRLAWRWSKGATLDPLDLGAPDATSRYTLCVFDREAGAARLATRLDVPPGAGWRRMRTGGGWMYADPTGSGDGVRLLRLKPDDDGKAWISFEAKGATLPLPAPVDGTRLFAMDPAVTVELVNVETDRCWRADFGRRGTRHHDGARYKASQVPGP